MNIGISHLSPNPLSPNPLIAFKSKENDFISDNIINI
jgi:hypothetical protein